MRWLPTIMPCSKTHRKKYPARTQARVGAASILLSGILLTGGCHDRSETRDQDQATGGTQFRVRSHTS